MVNESHAHRTAEQIFLELKKSAPKVSLATVYNNLGLLCSEGLIRRIPMEGSPDRYDKALPHDHLICRQCGRLADIRFQDLTGELKQQLGEDICGYDLKVFYLCPDCKKTNAEVYRNGREGAGETQLRPLYPDGEGRGEG
jgi:Fe2+ or Zn2+ uptake regulation protein